MPNLFQKIKKTYKEENITGIIRKARGFLSTHVYFRKWLWYERDLSLPMSDVATKISATIDVDAWDELLKWIHTEVCRGVLSQSEDYQNKMAKQNNHIYPCVKVNGRIAGFVKIGLGKVYTRNFCKVFQLNDKTSMVMAFYVAPEFRGLGLASLLLSSSIKFLREKGISKLTCYIRSTNYDSIRAFSKHDFKEIYSTWQLKIFKLNIFNENKGFFSPFVY